MLEDFSFVTSKEIEKEAALYIVATPIGNMGDITLRALTTLNQVDTIVAEDTRTSGVLLSKFQIKKPMLSFHAKSKSKDLDTIVEKLKNGERIAFISDAGTPSISDPGCLLVSEVRNRIPETKIIPIPGASAITAILSISGIPGNQFTFLGFIPQKNGRKTFLENMLKIDHSIVLYESPHRISKTLKEISEILGESRKVTIGRELTKQFEEIIIGEIKDVILHPKIVSPKGEYALIIWPK